MASLHRHRFPEFGVSSRRIPAGELEVDSSHPLAVGLVSWWLLNSLSVQDLFSKNHGTPVSTPTLSAGIHGPTIELSGTAPYYDCGSSTSLAITGAITVAAWVYPTSASADYRPVAARRNSTSQWQLYFDNQGGAGFTGNLSWYNGGPFGSTQKVPINVWSHVAATVTSGGALNLFYNGVSIFSNGSGSSPIVGVSANCFIGWGITADAVGFAGRISNLQVWKRNLSSQEILSLVTTPFAALRPKGISRTFVAPVSSAAIFRRTLGQRIGARV